MKTLKNEKHKRDIKRKIRRQLIDSAWSSIESKKPNNLLLKYLYKGVFDNTIETCFNEN